MGSRFNHEIVTDEVRRRLKRLARGGKSGKDVTVVDQLSITAKDTMTLAKTGARSLKERVARSPAGQMLKSVHRRLSATDEAASFNKTAPARTSQRSAPSRVNAGAPAAGEHGNLEHSGSAPASRAAAGHSAPHSYFQGQGQVQTEEASMRQLRQYDEELGRSPVRDRAWDQLDSEAKMPQWVQQDGQWSQPWQQQLYGNTSVAPSGGGRFGALPSVKRNRVAPLEHGYVRVVLWALLTPVF